MTKILFGILIISYSYVWGQDKAVTTESIPTVVKDLEQKMFPTLKKVKWNISDKYYIAESNCLTLVPDFLPNQNGYIVITFIKDNSWFSTYRLFVEPSDVNRNVAEDVIKKINLKLTELGDKVIGNIGITECAVDCTVPSDAMYAVFGINTSATKVDRYYFTRTGEYINWR